MSWSEEYSDDDNNSSDYSNDNYSIDNSNESGIYEKTEKNIEKQTENRIEKAEKTIEALRTYAWYRGLNLFMTNRCLQDLVPFV